MFTVFFVHFDARTDRCELRTSSENLQSWMLPSHTVVVEYGPQSRQEQRRISLKTQQHDALPHNTNTYNTRLCTSLLLYLSVYDNRTAWLMFSIDGRNLKCHFVLMTDTSVQYPKQPNVLTKCSRYGIPLLPANFHPELTVMLQLQLHAHWPRCLFADLPLCLPWAS